MLQHWEEQHPHSFKNIGQVTNFKSSPFTPVQGVPAHGSEVGWALRYHSIQHILGFYGFKQLKYIVQSDTFYTCVSFHFLFLHKFREEKRKTKNILSKYGFSELQKLRWTMLTVQSTTFSMTAQPRFGISCFHTSALLCSSLTFECFPCPQ